MRKFMRLKSVVRADFAESGMVLSETRRILFIFLKHSGLYMYRQFNIHCPHSVFMCLVWISEKQSLFLYTTLTESFV
jgi:hypothetical protein